MRATHLGTVFAFEDPENDVISTYRVHRRDDGDIVNITTETSRGTLLRRTEVGLEDLIGWLEKLRREEC